MADSRFTDQPDDSRDPSPDAPADSEAPEQMIVRHAPKVTPFLVSGAVLGVVVAFFWVGTVGASAEYSQTQTLSFFAALFAIVGLTVGALLWLILDRRSKRKVETVYARRTENPDAADVALTEDDYTEWSQLQQDQRIEHARREQFAQAKADAKAKKQSKRN